MEGSTTLIILALIVFLTCLFSLKRGNKKKGKQIPGPPLFSGLRHFLAAAKNNTLHHQAGRWAEQFGDLCYVNLLARKLVFINNVDLFRKLVNDSASKNFTNDRPNSLFSKILPKADFDMVFSPHGTKHKQARKLFHKALSFYGEGVGRFEDVMIKSLADFKHTLRQSSENVTIHNEFSRLVLQIVVALLTGFKSASEEETQTLKDLDEAINDIFLFENEVLLQVFPGVHVIPGLRIKRLYNTAKSCVKRFDHLFFERLKASYVPGEERGLVDQFLKAVESGLENTPSVTFNYGVIGALIRNVSVAGYLTTTNSLRSLFLQLINRPQLQDRIHEEICQVVGRHGRLSFSDRARMPYTEAVILETLRYANVNPFLVPHECREDIVFDGYLIEKGTTLMANVWHCHHGANKWEQPWEFRPERFLDAGGQLLDATHPQRQKLISFGIGPRSCPGESFARSRIFLVTVILLQEFMLVPAASAPLPSHDPRDWRRKATMGPDSFNCAIKLRE